MESEQQAAPRARRRAPLNRERVLRAAVALGDTGDIESLTMRRLAKKLRVESPMSLYKHVTNRDDLLDGMIDIVFGEIELPGTDVDWRLAMRRRAVSTREALARHRWAVGLMETRRHPGPANYRLHDAVLGCLRTAGFSVEMAIHAYSVQDAYIYGFAQQEKALAFKSPEHSAAVAQKRLGGVDPDLYPHIAEVVRATVVRTGYSFVDEFAFGLDLILDGLERLRAEPGSGA